MSEYLLDSQSQPILACKMSEVGRNNFSGFAREFNPHRIVMISSSFFSLFLFRGDLEASHYKQRVYSEICFGGNSKPCGLWFHHRW